MSEQSERMREFYADGRIRTCESTKLLGPEPSPFDHSGTSAIIREIIVVLKNVILPVF